MEVRIKELGSPRGIPVLGGIDARDHSWLPVTGSQNGWLAVNLLFVLSVFLRENEHCFSVLYGSAHSGPSFAFPRLGEVRRKGYRCGHQIVGSRTEMSGDVAC